MPDILIDMYVFNVDSRLHYLLWPCYDLDLIISYEERMQNLEDIMTSHKERTTFEDFSASVFAPVLPQGERERYQINKRLWRRMAKL